MAVPRFLSTPPIKEALIDIRIASDSAIDAARLDGLRPALAADYPVIENKTQFTAQIRIEGGKVIPSPSDLSFGGLFFSNAEKSQIAQFRNDGFTLNRLPPYSGAGPMIDEALRLWLLYSTAVNPTAVVRVGMRYINSLQLPFGERDDFSRFLAAAPISPEGAPQAVSTFLTRIVSHDGSDVVIVTQTLDPRDEVTKRNPVTIDIDTFRPEQVGSSPEELRAVLSRLRELKNAVFFGLLSEEALDLYQ